MRNWRVRGTWIMGITWGNGIHEESKIKKKKKKSCLDWDSILSFQKKKEIFFVLTLFLPSIWVGRGNHYIVKIRIFFEFYKYKSTIYIGWKELSLHRENQYFL